ncbi:MAG: host-nuclease inhibitor Gam family protein [Ignavibacterium sp.]|nr:host-nuclease inhibitor Gam family protein [Ignavibacterium sp.]MDW8376045.1 host-nuclease inhibitor Gam family protein [Ignavibacteriales bacterium]
MVIRNFQDVEIALGELTKQLSFIQKQEAILNKKITEARKKFDEDVADAQQIVDVIKNDIEQFCIKNKNEFEGKRSMEFKYGKIGFRINPPKVSQLNRKYTVATTLELVKKVFKGLYIRIKEEIDKDIILADYREGKLNDKKLASVGLKIDQGETFFIEPNIEQIEIISRTKLN